MFRTQSSIHCMNSIDFNVVLDIKNHGNIGLHPLKKLVTPIGVDVALSFFLQQELKTNSP